MDKKKADRIREKVKQEKNITTAATREAEFVELNAADIKSLEGMGLEPVKDDNLPYDEIEEMIFNNQTEVLGTTTKTDKKVGYSLDFKIMAIMFMEMFQREDENSGEMVPKFTLVARSLPGNTNESTMRYWWERREKILDAPTLVTDRMNSWLAIKTTRTLIRMNLALDRANFDNMLKTNPKVFTYLFNTMANKFRLFGNLSTDNVAHNHKVTHKTAELVPPSDRPKDPNEAESK